MFLASLIVENFENSLGQIQSCDHVSFLGPK